MLQWMGGSRRKVTTSRKSIQKRQKQYFEQRRRQQHQHTAQLDSLEEKGKLLEETNRDNRSLDILNLQNFSTTHNEQTPAFLSGRENPKANASMVKYHAITDPQIILASKVNTADSFKTNQASSSPHSQVETPSPEKFLVDSSNNCKNSYNKIYTPDCVRTESQQELPLFGLLNDDEINESFQEALVRESHVAFSVDGLGKVGTETPPSSPRQSDRFISYGFISPSKADRRLNLPRNHNYVLNGLKHQNDAMVHVEMPRDDSCMDFLTGIKDSYRKEMKNFSVVRDCMQLDSQEREVGSPFFDGKASCNTRSNYEDIWDDRSSFVDNNFLGEKKCNMAVKSRLYYPEASTPGSLEIVNDEMPDYAFDRVDLQQKRDASKATEIFNFLDSFSQKNRTSDYCHDLTNPRGARHHFVDTCFDFGDVTGNPDCSGFVLEDARGSLSLLSEESCSSTSVMAEINDVSLPSSRRRDNRRHHPKDFASDLTYYGEKTIQTKEKLVKNKDNFPEMPLLLDPKSGPFFPEEREVPNGNWLFEQGYEVADTNLGRHSACPTIKRKRPSTVFRVFAEDILHTSIPEPNIDANFSFSEHGVFSKFPPSSCCISEKCTSLLPCHNSPSLSKAEFPTRKPDVSSNSVESGLESSFTYSSSCHGDTLLSDVREVDSVSKSNECQPDTPQIKPSKEILVEKNMEGINTCSSKDSEERRVKTMLPEKISDKSESSVNKIEHHSDDEEPPGSEKDNKETERERNIAEKRHGNCPNSSSQLMMLESFVLQLLCVQKVHESTQ